MKDLKGSFIRIFEFDNQSLEPQTPCGGLGKLHSATIIAGNTLKAQWQRTKIAKSAAVITPKHERNVVVSHIPKEVERVILRNERDPVSVSLVEFN